MDVRSALSDAAARLDAAGVADPKREAASLLAFVLDKTNTFLVAHPEYELSEDESQQFAAAVARRESREPFQYITLRQEFYGLDIDVEPGVLIPRPETELIVGEAIKLLSRTSNPRFAEIGPGTGGISIAILKNVAEASADAADISPQAVALSRRNAEKHDVASRFDVSHGDLFETLAGPYDLIVSNPPYVPDADKRAIQPEVKFEPDTALYAGSDGLDVVRRIAAESADHLKPGGHLLVEIGIGQAAAVADLFGTDGWHAPEFLTDLQGIERTLKVRRLDA